MGGAEGKWREKEQEGGSGMGGWAVRGERRLEGRESWGEMESGGTEVWGGVGEGRGQSRKREERRREGGERRTADTAATVPCPLHRYHPAPAVNSPGQAVAVFHVFIFSSI